MISPCRAESYPVKAAFSFSKPTRQELCPTAVHPLAFLFRSPQKPSTFLLFMFLAEVTYLNSSTSSHTASHKPLPNHCSYSLPLSLVQGAITHPPIHKALVKQASGMPIPTWKLDSQSKSSKPKPGSRSLPALDFCLVGGCWLVFYRVWRVGVWGGCCMQPL